MRNKLNKLLEIVFDIFVLFIVMVYVAIAINLTLDDPKYGVGILVIAIYFLITKKGDLRGK